MKKLLAFLLAVTMLMCLCACGDDSSKSDKQDDGKTAATKAGSTTATTEEGEDTTTTTAGDADTTTSTEAENTTGATDTTATETESTTGTTAAASDPTKAPTSTNTTKAPTTTAKPTTTTTTKPEEPDEPVDTRPTIKILSIGHSFSRDAMDTYMADLFKAAGYNATFGYLYYPGCSLERQYHYVKDDTVSYEHYNKCVDGKWYEYGSAKATDALYDEDWDIVTFQPSPDYGKGTMAYECKWGCNGNIDNDYIHFDALVNLVKNKLKNNGNEDVQFYYHLTWAFATDCKLWSFMYSDWNQQTMFWDFWKATGKYVTTNSNIKGVIPCISSIQNVRTSWMGDTFNEPGGSANADGYHLNDKGDLVAAMTWVAYFTGKSAADFKIDTPYSDAQYAAFAEAVDNAIKKPMNITKSSYTTQP